MRPTEIFQGKWLGHPLHPAVVHVPVGLWIVAAILDLVHRAAPGGGSVPHLSMYCVVGGLVAALLAVPTGVADWSSIRKERPAWKLGLYHMVLNVFASVIWAANLGLRWKSIDTPEPVTTAIALTSGIGALMVILGGYIGSRMVFDHGVSIARLSKKKWRAIALRGGARLPQEK